MPINQVRPLTKEEIELADTQPARYLLLYELCQIPEFVGLWYKARLEIKPIMEAISSRLKERFLALSQEAKEILGKSTETTSQSQEKEAMNEVQRYINYLHAFRDELEKERDITDILDSYKSQVKKLIEPLGILGFHDDILLWDTQFWGYGNIFPGLVDIYANNSLESQVLREATELRPTELAITKPLEVQRRAMKKVSTLRKHHSRYRLRHRIHLWVRNVVFGERIIDIASNLQEDLQREEDGGYLQENWIKKQIGEASRILGVKRSPGRPRKGGVLRQWKLMNK